MTTTRTFQLVMLLVLTFAVLGAGLMTAAADQTVNGTFGPDSFTATFTVGGGSTPGTGEVITAGSLTLSGPTDPGVYNDWFAGDDLYGDTGVYLFQVSNTVGDPSNPPYIDLWFSDNSPISTASLCTVSNQCFGGYGWQYSQFRPIYSPSGSGYIGAPEPATMSLLVFGLLGLGFLFRKEGPQTEGPATR